MRSAGTSPHPGRDQTGRRITYIRTREGFVHPATVIDCHSKAVIGWAMAGHYRTERVKDAPHMTIDTGLAEPDAIFHTDHGSNHTSDTSGRYCANRRIHRPTGRTGVRHDNAMAESFFTAIKTECPDRFVLTTRAKARQQVIRSIEGFCNRRRPHSALGYRTPLAALAEHPRATQVQPTSRLPGKSWASHFRSFQPPCPIHPGLSRRGPPERACPYHRRSPSVRVDERGLGGQAAHTVPQLPQRRTRLGGEPLSV
ncbi:integrase core domain-containing protein [Streptosporangium sp. NPDC020145]|uniref:integrase core domain-containing protein n=1 Tax=Streptosporangium sp. NPDC020145 TaxID=3154694 RepID=UPI0034426535